MTYLVDFLAIGWAPMRHVAWISPFHYYPALSIVAGDARESRNLLTSLLSSADRASTLPPRSYVWPAALSGPLSSTS